MENSFKEQQKLFNHACTLLYTNINEWEENLNALHIFNILTWITYTFFSKINVHVAHYIIFLLQGKLQFLLLKKICKKAIKEKENYFFPLTYVLF